MAPVPTHADAEHRTYLSFVYVWLPSVVVIAELLFEAEPFGS